MIITPKQRYTYFYKNKRLKVLKNTLTASVQNKKRGTKSSNYFTKIQPAPNQKKSAEQFYIIPLTLIYLTVILKVLTSSSDFNLKR